MGEAGGEKYSVQNTKVAAGQMSAWQQCSCAVKCCKAASHCTVLLFQDQVATGSRQRRERFIKNPLAWLELESSKIPLNRLESSGIPKNPLEPSETKLPPTDRGRLKGLAEPTFSLFYNPST